MLLNVFMIEALISSKTRIKLLLKFFLNSSNKSYLRGLETEFGDSTNGIRLELNKLEEAGLLKTRIKGNKKIFQPNKLERNKDLIQVSSANINLLTKHWLNNILACSKEIEPEDKYVIKQIDDILSLIHI